MNTQSFQSAFSVWWDGRCQRYLDESLGPVGEEIRPQVTALLFPPAAEPTLPEQTLPLAFVHLRLLAGEDLSIILKRLERLGKLYGLPGAKPSIGTIYLILTSLTSTPGKLSSLVQAQSAFFSLLLRRVAVLLDRGSDESEVREEMAEVWEINSEQAVSATLAGGRGLWRRSRDPLLGAAPLPFELKEWMSQNNLSDEMEASLNVFPHAASHPHLEVLAERMAAVDVLLRAEGVSDDEARVVREHTRLTVQESLTDCMGGLVPWETEALCPTVPLLGSLEKWSNRLQLLGGGETPTARPGRERLPDWLIEMLNEELPGENGGIISERRLIVGGSSYLIAGFDAVAFSSDLAMVSPRPPVRGEGAEVLFRVRFGNGTERSFRFDLGDGKDLLAAIRLAVQADIRMDLFLRTEDGQWCFAASRYLLPNQEDRDAWLRLVLEYCYQEFGGEEDRIKVAILKGVGA